MRLIYLNFHSGCNNTRTVLSVQLLLGLSLLFSILSLSFVNSWTTNTNTKQGGISSYSSGGVFFKSHKSLDLFRSDSTTNERTGILGWQSPQSRNQKAYKLFSNNDDDDSSNDNNNDNEDDMEMFEALKEISDKKSEESLTMRIREKSMKVDNNENNDETTKLGIDIGSMLEPLSEKDAAELKAAAIEIINDAYAAGMDEIETLRIKMENELQVQRQISNLNQQYKTKVETEKLLSKIDQLTNKFLTETSKERIETKLAAAADAATASNKDGIEFGSWGTIDGVTITTDSLKASGIGNSAVSASASALLGSVESAKQQLLDKQQSSESSMKDDIVSAASTPSSTVVSTVIPKRIIIIADENGADPIAKQLVQPLKESIQSIISDIDIIVYKPTSTIPIGGNGAQCIIMFLTSLNDSKSIQGILDRVVRTTVIGSTIIKPPTQFIAISSIGTTRYNKMPYNVINIMNGGKLEKRQQMEETLIKFINTRSTVSAGTSSTTGFDYTIAKFGEIKPTKDVFQFTPFDTIDGTIDIQTATTILTQAIAYQPAARNATFCCSGTLLSSSSTSTDTTTTTNEQQELLDDVFVKLYGPEIYRTIISINDIKSTTETTTIELLYDDIVEYIVEWAKLLASNGKGLTTPVRATVPSSLSKVGSTITTTLQQNAIQLLFLPTNTGRNYISKEEEKERTNLERSSSSSSSANTPPRQNSSSNKIKKDGGIEFVTEFLSNNTIRLRARRCNYSYDATIKELSEETIVNRFKKSIDVWKSNHC